MFYFCVCFQEQFEQYGKVERVKKIKDYAFVHFEDRDSAVVAMRSLNGKEVGASNMEVSIFLVHNKTYNFSGMGLVLVD